MSRFAAVRPRYGRSRSTTRNPQRASVRGRSGLRVRMPHTSTIAAAKLAVLAYASSGYARSPSAVTTPAAAAPRPMPPLVTLRTTACRRSRSFPVAISLIRLCCAGTAAWWPTATASETARNAGSPVASGYTLNAARRTAKLATSTGRPPKRSISAPVSGVHSSAVSPAPVRPAPMDSSGRCVRWWK